MKGGPAKGKTVEYSAIRQKDDNVLPALKNLFLLKKVDTCFVTNGSYIYEQIVT